MQHINWGIIGCGDVTEIKSGPAFNKVPDSSLVAVMRRDTNKAKDYAMRHKVPKWYDDASALINDPEVNAIYVATPPSSHEAYAIAALQAGKPVYVEKPMTINYSAAVNIVNAAKESNIKISVAHYRREQPYFKKIKELIDEKSIGEIKFVRLLFCKTLLTDEDLQLTGNSWRINADISGGGLFHDLAPHQLDLMYYFFGDVHDAEGIAANQSKKYNADDIVAGNILFKNGVIFNGLWCFNMANKKENETDTCEIVGSKGSISFSVFNEQKIYLMRNSVMETIAFNPPEHVQQPMINKVVKYFLNKAGNPCSVAEAAQVMKLIDAFTQTKKINP